MTGEFTEAIEHHVRVVLAGLEENSQEVVEEGGRPVSLSARDIVAEATSCIVTRALLSPNYSFEDFKITPFARTDSGAHLLVDYRPTDKRLSVRIGPDGADSWATLTTCKDTRGEAISAPEKVALCIDWLTNTGPANTHGG